MLTLLIAIPVLLVAGKKHLKPKRMTISAPVSFHKRSVKPASMVFTVPIILEELVPNIIYRTIKCGSLDIVIDHAPTIKNRYTFGKVPNLCLM